MMLSVRVEVNESERMWVRVSGEFFAAQSFCLLLAIADSMS